jgi:DNA-binding transcriptional LysR family regulator
MRNITLRHLRTTLAIHAEGKIISAAKRLGLTAPAVTLQLQQAEEEVGIQLFERSVHGMRPTDAGLAFIRAGQFVDERLRLLQEEIDAVRGVRKGRLVVGAVSTAKYFAPQIIAAFKREFPDIDLKLVVGNRAETIAKLKDHILDLALMGRPPPDLQVQARVFGDHPLCIVAPPDHPLADKRDIAKARIAQEHFIVREPGSGTRTSFELFIGDLPGRLDDPGTEMDSNETIKQAVMAGLGVAFISAHTVAFEVEAGRLAVLDVVGMPIRRQWFSVIRIDSVVTPALSAFQSFLAQRGATFLPILSKLYPAT